MSFEFKLPDLGEDIDQAEVTKLLVEKGDEVEADQDVVEVMTEKATAAVPCPEAGKVTSIHVEEGDTIQPGDPLLTLDGASGKGRSEEESGEDEDESSEGGGGTRKKKKKKKKAKAARRKKATKQREEEEGAGSGDDEPGSGEGRATKQKEQPDRTEEKDEGGKEERYGSRTLAPEPVTRMEDHDQWGPTERRRLGGVRAAAARRLESAWRTVPQVTHFDAADVTDLEDAREKLNESDRGDHAVVTITAIAVKAAAAVLEHHPELNASLDAPAQEIVLKKYVHVGVAVDTDGGLLVPVVRDAAEKSILEIADEIEELAERARGRSLDPAEMEGASFTVTNLGGIGGTGFTPIVDPPQAAILGLGHAREECRFVEGRPEPRLLLPLCLSYDHRLVDGARAARFTSELAGLLASPPRFLGEL